MSYWRISFNGNPLNGHYLYPPFSPIQGLKRKKTPLSKGSKKFCPRAIYGDLYLLGHLRVYGFRKKLKKIAVRTFVPQILNYDQTIHCYL